VYGWVWNRMPGPWPAKLVWSAAGIAAVVVLLFTLVFPWLEPRLPFNDVTVDDGSGSGSGTVSSSTVPGPVTSPEPTQGDGTVREITTPGDGPTVTPSVVGSPSTIP
jgi:hypothetical protein